MNNIENNDIMKAIDEIAKSESYNIITDSKKRKSYDTRLKELIKWYEDYGEVHKFYNLYDCDMESIETDAYLDYKSFASFRDKWNLKGLPYSQIGLLQDKFLFYKYLKANQIPVVPCFAFYQSGKCYNENMQEINIRDITEKDFFVKSTVGLAGNDVRHYDSIDDFLMDENEYSKRKYKYIFQPSIKQSEAISKIYSGGVSSMRIVTVNINGEISVLAKALRIPTLASGRIDNFSRGGVAVGVENDGRLKKYGKIKVLYDSGKHVIEEHPDTHIKFSDCYIEEYENALNLVKNAHRFFYNMGSIGWDVVFTTDGVKLLEGNDNWGLGLVQSVDRPLKKEWNSIVSKIDKSILEL